MIVFLIFTIFSIINFVAFAHRPPPPIIPTESMAESDGEDIYDDTAAVMYVLKK